MKNFFRILFLTFLIFLQVRAEDDEMMLIDSELADFDGKKITLTGKVAIEHELGKISANQVVLFPEDGEKKMRFSLLKLNDEVTILLNDGGQLNCSLAELDYQTLTGKFFGSPQQEYVVYTEICRDKDHVIVPLVVKSRQMAIQILREDETHLSKTPRSSISQMTAESNVTVNYNHDFIVSADHAMYQRLSPLEEREQPSRLPGLISFRALEQTGTCEVTNRHGDLIRANQICIDTNKRQLLFVYPKGTILSLNQAGEMNRIDFSSDTLMWDEMRNLVVLRDHVLVNHKGIGQIGSQEEVQIFQQVVDGHKRLKSINSSGETTLNYSEENGAENHLLTCYGKMIVDHDALTTYLESPKDLDGKVLEAKQVFFQDRLGEVYADKATLSYEIQNQSIVLKKIVLSGNVRIFNRTVADVDDPGKFLQYALADNVEFFPQTKEMHFSSLQNRRILFFDKVNNIQVSAPALHIKRNSVTNKDSIQGFGDVRFSFLESEFEQLRQRFNLSKDQNQEEPIKTNESTK